VEDRLNTSRETSEQREQWHAKQTAGSSYVGVFVGVIAALLSVRLASLHLSKEEFGLWGVLFQLFGYFSLLELGVVSAMGRVFVEPLTKRSESEASRWIATTAMIVNVQGVVIFFVGVCMTKSIFSFIHIPAQMLSEAQALWIGVLLIHLLQTPGKPYIGVLHASNRVVYVNAIGILVQILMVGLFWIFLTLGYRTSSYVWSYGLAGVTGSILYWVAARRNAPILFSLHPRHFEFGKLKKLLSFSMGLFALNASVQITVAGQGLLIARFLSLAEVAAFSVTGRMAAHLAVLFQKTIEAYLPKWSLEWSGGSRAQASDGFRRVYTGLIHMMPLLILWTVLVNPWFVQWWTGVDYYSGNPTNIALGLGAIFLIVNRAMQIMLLIKMSVKKMALITGAGAIMEILLYFLLIPRMGVLGVPTASCLANILWTTPWMVRHALDGWGIQALFMHLKLAGALIASLMIAYFVGGYIGQTDGKPLQQFATAFAVGLIFSAVLCFRLWVLNKTQKAAGE